MISFIAMKKLDYMTMVYVSVDVEASGPFPPDYSMLSVGAMVVGNPSVKFYREFCRN